METKKKELIGDFKNAGREDRPKGMPEPVRVHDFLDKELGKAIPYGVYDLSHNQGWVSVGIDHDTGALCRQHDRARWWREMGAERFPKATGLLIMADGGGSNSSRHRLALESRLAEARGGVGIKLGGLSFSARHEQVEQD